MKEVTARMKQLRRLMRSPLEAQAKAILVQGPYFVAMLGCPVRGFVGSHRLPNVKHVLKCLGMGYASKRYNT